MPRNGSGTFTLVSGNPVVTGTTIESNWANTTLSDIATAMTDSLSRSGQGGMTAALRIADGTQSAPGLGFANETQTGIYRAGTGEVWAVVQGAQTLNLDASGVYVPADKSTTVDGAFVFNEAGADKDARFEGDTDANLLFTDASTDRVGVGTNAPATKLNVRGATQNKEVALRWERATDGAVAGGLGYFYDSENSLAVGSVTNHPFKIITNDVTAATFDTSGNLGLGVAPSAWGSNFRSLDVLSFGASVASSSAGNTLTSVAHNAYNDNTNWRYRASSIGAARYEMTGANGGSTHAWYVSAGGTAGNAITFTQAMTLDASGNLALGQTSAAYRLDVLSGADVAIRARTSNSNEVLRVESTGTTNAAIRFINTAANTVYIGSDSGALNFLTNNTERARITSGGEVVVNDTAAVAGAAFSSNAFSGTAAAGFKSNASTVYAIVTIWGNETSGNQIFTRFATDANQERGTIAYNRAGGLVAYNTTSDYRAKDIIGPVQNPGATIDALKVYEGVMKGATQSRPMLIAHEAQAHAPYAVSGVKDEVNEDGTPKFQQMDVSSLVPLLLAEMQSLRARVAALEARP